MDAFLRVKTGQVEKSVRLRSQPLTIGRHESNSLVLDESLASRFHCVIERGVGKWIVRDLQSRNGTTVNGTRVMQAELKHGDVIGVGAVEMTLVSRDARSSSTAGRQISGSNGPPPIPGAAAGIEEMIDELEVVEEKDLAKDPVTVLKALRRAADALLEKHFEAAAIQLITMRGKFLHETQGPPGEIDLLLRLILLICFRSHATDIHLEPRVDDYLLRIRMDGNLLDITPLPQELGVRLTALVKVLCELDTTQKHIVQEGHFAASTPWVAKAGLPGQKRGDARRVDYRVSFVPSLHGQKLVVRVFDTAHGPQLIEELQLPERVAVELSEELNRDAGLILVCGPTGSGKTTTLYSLIRSCGASFRNIVTIEDPVEVQIGGTTQLPVDEENGKSFAALLRSVLRQDPDVIMVGEIRDPETAKIALQAAMTGHLVLSTIHTRDTAGTIFRLLDLGIEPYVVAQGLHLVLAQRLVRTLCQACKRAITPSDDDRRRMGRLGETVQKIYAPAGCPKCLGTGFYSRRAFFEFMATTDVLREEIMKRPGVAQIQATQGPDFVRLAEHGYELVVQGLTSLDEVDRSVGR
jgi:general secretion pathway protein E